MSTVTDADLKEIKDLIVANQKALETRLGAIENGQGEIKGEIKALDTKIQGIDKRLAVIEGRFEGWKPAIDKIPDLAEKVGELKNCGAVRSWWSPQRGTAPRRRQIVIILLTAVISGSITWVIRGGNLRP